MWFVKDLQEFEQWQKDHESIIVDKLPASFPCYVDEYVSDWSQQECTAEYLCESDLKEMLARIESAQQSVQRTAYEPGSIADRVAKLAEADKFVSGATRRR